MIGKLNKKDINEIMKLWLRITTEAHSFISKDYWINNYEYVMNNIRKVMFHVEHLVLILLARYFLNIVRFPNNIYL